MPDKTIEDRVKDVEAVAHIHTPGHTYDCNPESAAAVREKLLQDEEALRQKQLELQKLAPPDAAAAKSTGRIHGDPVFITGTDDY